MLHPHKVGFVEIGVYRVSFYVDTAGAAHFLNDFKGKGHGDLVKDDAFYSELMKAKFRKTFHLRFVRSLGKQKLQDGFWKSLRDYLAPEDCADGQQLIWAIPDVKEHDVLTLRFAHDGETAEIAHNGEPPHLVVVNPNVWLAVQRIYFDAKTEYPAIRTGAITSLPDALLTAAPYEPPPVAAVHRASMSVESDFLDCDSFIGDLGVVCERPAFPCQSCLLVVGTALNDWSGLRTSVSLSLYPHLTPPHPCPSRHVHPHTSTTR